VFAKPALSLAGLGLAASLLAGCDDAPPASAAEASREPSSAALYLFELARQDDPDVDELTLLFGSDDEPIPRAELYDALEAVDALVGQARPEIVRVTELEELQRTAVDLDVEIEGGISASFSVHLEPVEPEGWSIHWFQGPGVAWPRFRRRGPGLTSAPSLEPG
jgi:hypothetical protein